MSVPEVGDEVIVSSRQAFCDGREAMILLNLRSGLLALYEWYAFTLSYIYTKLEDGSLSCNFVKITYGKYRILLNLDNKD